MLVFTLSELELRRSGGCWLEESSITISQSENLMISSPDLYSSSSFASCKFRVNGALTRMIECYLEEKRTSESFAKKGNSLSLIETQGDIVTVVLQIFISLIKDVLLLQSVLILSYFGSLGTKSIRELSLSLFLFKDRERDTGLCWFRSRAKQTQITECKEIWIK